MAHPKPYREVLHIRRDIVQTRIDEASSTVTYIGYSQIGTAASDTGWIIKKITVSGDITTILYAEGDDETTNIWDSRTGYSYS